MKTLIYDGDCGFCTRSANWLQNKAEGVTAVAWQTVDLQSFGLSTEQVLSAAYLIDEHGVVHRGAEAIGQALRTGPFPWNATGRVVNLWPVSLLARLGYVIVARYRHRLPGSTEACRIAPEKPPRR